jgi:hypothetical protein
MILKGSLPIYTGKTLKWPYSLQIEDDGGGGLDPGEKGMD